MRWKTGVVAATAMAVLWPGAAGAGAVRTVTNPYYGAGSHSGGVAYADSSATGYHLRLDASHTCPTLDCGLNQQFATREGETRQAAWVRERFVTNGSDFEISVTLTITDFATFSVRPDDEPTIGLYVKTDRDLEGFPDYCSAAWPDGIARDVTGKGTFTWTCKVFSPRFGGDDGPRLYVDVFLNAYLTQRSSLFAPTTARVTTVVNSVTLRPIS